MSSSIGKTSDKFSLERYGARVEVVANPVCGLSLRSFRTGCDAHVLLGELDGSVSVCIGDSSVAGTSMTLTVD